MSSKWLSTPLYPIELRVPEELSDVRRCIYIVERYNGAMYNSRLLRYMQVTWDSSKW